MEHQKEEDFVSNACVLLVDDEENILNSLHRLLRRQGYQILKATSGKEGLEFLKNEKVDLVVSDMRMPEMDGAEFLSKVSKQYPDVVRILLTGFSDMDSTVEAVNRGGIYRYLSKPWEDSELILTIQNGLEKKHLEAERKRLMLLTSKQNKQLKEFNSNLEDRVKERTLQLAKSNESVSEANKKLKDSYLTTVRVFSELIDMRSDVLNGHSRKVAEVAVGLAKKMGVKGPELMDILYASLLHDIGKISIKDSLINMPYEILDGENQEIVQRHPIVAEALLMQMEPLRDAAKIIRSHHELYDGSGYPEGLSGEKIPLGARIIAVVDDCHELQMGTLAARRLTLQQAREYILENRGKRYDPIVVDAFIEGGVVTEKASIQEKGSRKMKSSDLEAGMILADDLATPDGTKILDSGYVLDDQIIMSIHRIEEIFGQMVEVFIEC